ncbi:hypothetical protein [Corynebacterium mastitidis]|uniref:hypothetical protein n=1 Tax=Corynebacterium mastitidis TaxID=161890 RepID=UPI0012FF2D8B|nr:hypothetical protein [Corynebacterium mastitidis]
MELQFVEEKDIPNGIDLSRRHPIDVEIRENLIANPGKWAIYPWEERYPKREFNTAYSGVYSMTRAKKIGIYRVTENGKFEVRCSKTEKRVYIRYVEAADVEQ